MALAKNSEFLYANDGGTHMISAFRVEADGTLTRLAGVNISGGRLRPSGPVTSTAQRAEAAATMAGGLLPFSPVIVYPAIDIYEGRAVRHDARRFRDRRAGRPVPLEAAKKLVADGAGVAPHHRPRRIAHRQAREPRSPPRDRHRFTVKIQAGGRHPRSSTQPRPSPEAGRVAHRRRHRRDRRPRAHRRLVDRHADGLAVSVDETQWNGHDRRWTETTNIRAVDLMQRLAVTACRP